MSEIVKDLITRQERMATIRTTYEPTWEEIGVNVILSNTTIYSDNPKGSNDNAEAAYSSFPAYSADRLASVMNSMLTNQASEWFRWETDNKEANDVPSIKRYLEDITEITHKELTNSNLYDQIRNFYYSLTTYGTGIMYIEKDTTEDHEVRFDTRHLRECYLDEDKYGFVDTVFRKCKMTARQMFQRWGKDTDEDVQKAMEKAPDTEYEILHAVYPRDERDTSKGARANPKNFRYASVWVDLQHQKILSEGGYEQFPYVVARWSKEPGEVYGRSPAYLALPEVKSLNSIRKSFLEILQKISNPSIFVTGELRSVVDLTPGGVTVGGPDSSVQAINEQKNAQACQEAMNDCKELIGEVFYNNNLQVIDKANMTAAEVNARLQENARILGGGVFNNITSEAIERLLIFVAYVLQTSVKMDGSPIFPPAPQEAGNASLRIKYQSQLSNAQKQAEGIGMSNTFMFIMEAANVRPDVLDNLNVDMMARKYGEINGAPPEMFLDMEQVAAIRQQRQQQMEQQQQMEAEAAEASAAKDASVAGKNIVDARKELEEAPE